MENYTWKPAFEAVGAWLRGYENRQLELIRILKDVGISNGFTDKKSDGSESDLTEIDPFTFFSFFMKHKNTETRKKLFERLLDKVGLQTPIPNDFSGVPFAQPQRVWLFGNTIDRKTSDIPILWRFYEAIASDSVTDELFAKVLDIHNVGFAKITQCIFYAFPEQFLPIDSQTRPWLTAKKVSLPSETWSDYQRCLSDVRNLTEQPFYELSHEAWLANQAGGSETVSENKAKYSDEPNEAKKLTNVPLNQVLYGPPGTGKTYETTERAVQIADQNWYRRWKSSSEEASRELLKAKYDELVSLGRIRFLTFHQSFSYEDFIEGIRASSEEGAIHYSIEDGVFKSIADTASANTGDRKPKSAVSVEGKRIWKMSLGNTLGGEDHIFADCIENGYAALGWGDDIDFSGCDTRDKVFEKYNSVSSSLMEATNYPVTAVNTFINKINLGDLVVVSDGNTKIRAIGEVTSDYKYVADPESGYFNQTREVQWHRKFEPSIPREEIMTRAISQMAIYELKEHALNYEQLKYYLGAKPNDSSENANYVLIIDEINRGNVSRVFGEVITLLESNKRAGSEDARRIMLPYSKKPFSVPPNLYVIGTMNTADRSLAQIDLALRRRFDFIESMPKPELLAGVSIYNVPLDVLLKTINSRIEVLLDRDHLIGHSYFWDLLAVDIESKKQEKLADVFRKRIIPLLQEYFYDDWERIAWVLNDQNKAESNKFIQFSKGSDLERLFGQATSEKLNDRRYVINQNAFYNELAFQQIIEVAD